MFFSLISLERRKVEKIGGASAVPSSNALGIIYPPRMEKRFTDLPKNEGSYYLLASLLQFCKE